MSEPPLVEGEVAAELAEEWPGLRLASMTFGFVPGKSPRELMTGQGHPHWLTLLGLGPLQPQRA